MSRGLLGALRDHLQSRADRRGEAPEPEALPTTAAAVAAMPATRRDRELAVPRELLDGALAQKVLHGWLQNRHQVLVPLTLRLGSLPENDVAMLMQMLGAVHLCASRADVGRRAEAERWIRQAGGGAAALRAFAAALEEPPALSAALGAVVRRKIEPHAYAAIVGTTDFRDPAGQALVAFVAARLALPPEAVRSINRRYRR